MQRLFGKTKLDPNVTTKIFSFFDSKTLAVNALLVNKDWQKTVHQDELKEATELAKARLVIDKKIFRHCTLFQKETPDSVGLKRISGGWTNKTFLMKQGDNQYVIRLPGIKSEMLIDRKAEAINARIASDFGINPQVIFSGDEGTQVTHFINNPVSMEPADFKDLSNIEKFVQALKVLHDSPIQFANTTSVFERIHHMEHLLQEQNIKLAPEYAYFSKKMAELEKLYHQLDISVVPSHGDAIPYNVIYSKEHPDKLFIIDWEYSCNTDPVWDLTYFAVASELETKQQQHLLHFYCGKDNIDPLVSCRFALYKPMIDYWMALWTNIQIMNKNFSNSHEGLIAYEKFRREGCKKSFDGAEYASALAVLEENIVARGVKPRF